MPQATGALRRGQAARLRVAIGLLATVLALWHLATAFSQPAVLREPALEDTTGVGVGIINEVIGEIVLPKPLIFSPRGTKELWRELGVNVRGCNSPDAYTLEPQDPSGYRALGDTEAAFLRDMRGESVASWRNPGIRVEPNVVSEAEETLIVEQLLELAQTYGYDFVAPHEDAQGQSLRLTGRDEKRSGARLAPWGWGTELDRSKLPSGLATAASNIEALAGYPLGPLRDVTVNIRSSVDYQMAPHIDPLPDGPNSFVLSLLSSAVVTFSPVTALRNEAERANDDEDYARRSYTDEDLDCLVPRRAAYHFSGEARYQWTHAVRPPATRLGEMGLEAFDWWGNWDKVLRRQKERAAIIFTFADPEAH